MRLTTGKIVRSIARRRINQTVVRKKTTTMVIIFKDEAEVDVLSTEDEDVDGTMEEEDTMEEDITEEGATLKETRLK